MLSQLACVALALPGLPAVALHPQVPPATSNLAEDAVALLDTIGFDPPAEPIPIDYDYIDDVLVLGDSPGKIAKLGDIKWIITFASPNVDMLLRTYGISNVTDDHRLGFLCGGVLHEWGHIPQGGLSWCGHFWLFNSDTFAFCDLAGDLAAAGASAEVIQGACAAFEHSRRAHNRLLPRAKQKCPGAAGVLPVPPCPACA
ncbi:MAG: hypothetical protein AAFZ65_01340 [Planctomycetota bacterium]